MLLMACLGFQLRMEVHIPAALLSMVLVGHSTLDECSAQAASQRAARAYQAVAGRLNTWLGDSAWLVRHAALPCGSLLPANPAC